jgi:ubiquinone/menaquinone biosynthesis C-methylase UbiE
LSTPCEVCDHTPLAPLFEKDGYPYEKCPDCGLIRIHPQPTDETLEAIYQNDYYGTWGKSEDVFRSLKQKTFASILNMIPEESRGGKLLDVGAGTGILMELARESCYELYGVEVARDGIEAITRKFGAEHVIPGYFEKIDFAAMGLISAFDVVTMIDLLEHVREPNEALRKAFSLLKTKGYLLLCLPDTSSLTARIFKKRWNLYATEHLFSFSKICLSRLLRNHGFKVCKLQAAPKFMTIEYIHNHLLRNPGVFGFLCPLLALTPSPLKRIPIPFLCGQMKVVACKEED